MTLLWKVLLWYLLVMNLIAFAVCGIDKKKARRGAWRIPEKTLFLLSGLGGCYGFLMGMLVFHHKTRHWSFRILIPVFCLLWTAGIGAGLWFFR